MCPHPDEILTLAALGARHPGAAKVAEHVLQCAFCLDAYAQTRAAMGASAASNQPERPRNLFTWKRAWAPSLGFASGAVVAIAVLWMVLVAPIRSREVRLRAALALEHGARLRQEAADARAVLDLRSRTTAAPAVRIADSGDAAALEAAILSRKLPIAAGVRDLVPRTRSPQGERAGIRLRRPVETFLLSEPVVLTTEQMAGVTGTKAYLTDSAGVEVSITRVSPFVWEPSSPLRAGETFQWSVEGMRGGERLLSPVAAFGIVDAHTETRIRSAQKQYRDHPLVLAVLYARAGLLDDAESALIGVLKHRPRESVAAALLSDLKRARSRD